MGGFEIGEDDAPHGTLTSLSFEVTHPFASYRIGGDCHSSVRMELVEAGTDRVMFVTHGRNSEMMHPEALDLRRHRGKRFFVRLVDEQSGGFGQLNFDDFRFHETRPVFVEAVNMVKIVGD